MKIRENGDQDVSQTPKSINSILKFQISENVKSTFKRLATQKIESNKKIASRKKLDFDTDTSVVKFPENSIKRPESNKREATPQEVKLNHAKKEMKSIRSKILKTGRRNVVSITRPAVPHLHLVDLRP